MTWRSNSRRVAALLLVLLGADVGRAVARTAAPELPRISGEVPPPPTPTRLVRVPAGASLQAALDAARPGDALLLDGGATYTGSFRLPAKPGDGWITIRTSVPDGQLPRPGQRATPNEASLMAKIVANGVTPAIEAAPGARRYRLIGLEITIAPQAAFSYGLVVLGSGSASRVEDLPSEIVLDRVYVHGLPDKSVRRGVALNGAWSAVVDSWISDIHEANADSQAIAGWNGPGPFVIANSYLEAAGENVLFGGGDPRVPGLVPSDIVVRRNHLAKPSAWRGGRWTVKNLFELKNAQRVLVEGNLLERNWPAGQNGYAVLFTPRNQDGTAPWSVVQDVTFSRNVLRDVAAGFNILATDNNHPSQVTRRIRISDNLLLIDGATWGGQGRLLQCLDGPTDIAVEHNTIWQSGEMLVASGAPVRGFVFRDNIVPAHGYGIGGDNTFGNVRLSLATYFPDAVFASNVIVDGAASAYPAGNAVVARGDVGFAAPADGRWDLAPTSPLKGRASDGRDPGADMAALSAALGSGGAVITSARTTIGGVASCDAAPTNLRASIDGTLVTLAWDAAAPPLTGYALEAGTRSGLRDLVNAPLPAAQTSLTAAVPPGLYFVRVRAVTACGTGAASGELILRVGAGTLPDAPLNLTAVATGGAVSLSWSAPAGPLVGYVLEVGTTAGRADLGATLLGVGTSLTVGGVPRGTYAVRVRALSPAGTGPASNEIVVRVP